MILFFYNEEAGAKGLPPLSPAPPIPPEPPPLRSGQFRLKASDSRRTFTTSEGAISWRTIVTVTSRLVTGYVPGFTGCGKIRF
jgi:hypothetical protein